MSPIQRPRARRKALPPASAPPAPLEVAAGPANGVAHTLDRFTERIDVLTQAVDGLRSQLESHSRQVEVVVSDVSDRLNTLKEAADEMGRLRVALAEQPKAEIERQVTELLDEVKATRRSVAVSSGKRKSVDADTVERIVRSVVERLAEGPPAPKKSRGRRPSVAG
jgi:archaellum component FlaC